MIKRRSHLSSRLKAGEERDAGAGPALDQGRVDRVATGFTIWPYLDERWQSWLGPKLDLSPS